MVSAWLYSPFYGFLLGKCGGKYFVEVIPKGGVITLQTTDWSKALPLQTKSSRCLNSEVWSICQTLGFPFTKSKIIHNWECVRWEWSGNDVFKQALSSLHLRRSVGVEKVPAGGRVSSLNPDHLKPMRKRKRKEYLSPSEEDSDMEGTVRHNVYLDTN